MGRALRAISGTAALAAALVPVGGVTPASAADGPEVVVGDSTVWEGDQSVRSLYFPVTLSTPPASGTVTVSYTIGAVDATPGTPKLVDVDFNDKKGATKTLTFKAGQVAKYVAVPVYADQVVESTETLTVTLSAPSTKYTLGRTVGTGTILDDDVQESTLLTIGDAAIGEGDSTKRVAKFPLTLSRAESVPVTVDYRIVPGTATGGYQSGSLPPGTDLRDFKGATRTVVFKPSVRTGLTPIRKVIPVTAYPDTDAEPDETFQVEILNVDGAAAGDDTATGTILDDDGPVPVAATALASSWKHRCALLANSTLKCWGGNQVGALGQGDINARGDDPGEMGDNLAPIDLGTGRSVTAVAAGISTEHTCALLDDGTVKCWGYNNSGELGLGDTIIRGDDPGEMGDNLPTVDLGTGRTATALANAGPINCALLDDATLKCWGANGGGQLGLGDTMSRGDDPGEMGDNLPPIDLGTGRTAVAITVSGAGPCALLDNGTVKCWGASNYGQLGQGDNVRRGDNPG